MPYTISERRRVFLACRSIFVGQHAQLRKSKKVRELVQSHKKSLQQLLKDISLDKVVDIIKILLDGRIFESEPEARKTFPELYRRSPARDAQRAASANEAARSEAEALEEVASLVEKEPEPRAGLKNDVPDLEGEALETEQASWAEEYPGQYANCKCGTCTNGVVTPNLNPSTNDIKSLYPVYFPYKIQHIILTSAQSLLEACCFDFATEWMPSILEEQGWDCPEAIELTEWTKIMSTRCNEIPAHAIDNNSGVPLDELFRATSSLRHSAVHRLPTNAKSIDRMIISALNLAKTLRDSSRAKKLEVLHFELDDRIRDMELNKNFLENRLEEELEAIREARAELDRRENEAKATMLKEDRENKFLVGSLLEKSAWKLFNAPDCEPEGSGDVSEVDEVESANENHKEGSQFNSEGETCAEDHVQINS